MKLYDDKLAPNPRRVRIFMAEKGITVDEVVQVSVLEGENLDEDFRAKNPLGKVPALELDDGTVIAETVTICRYLEELHPEPALFGADAKERALVDMWQRFAEWDGLLPVAMAFRNAYPGFKDRGFAGVPEATPQVPGMVEPARAMAMRNFGLFDRRLATTRYLAGDRFSIADITAMVAIDFGKVTRTHVMADDRPNLARWYAEVSARPSAGA